MGLVYHTGAHLKPFHSVNADPEPLFPAHCIIKTLSWNYIFMWVLGTFQAAQLYPLLVWIGLKKSFILDGRWFAGEIFKSLGRGLAGYSRRGGEKQLPAARLRSPWTALLVHAVGPGAGAWKLRFSLVVRGCRAPLLKWSLPANSVPFGDQSVQPPANLFSRE